MLNGIFLALILGAIATAAFNGRMSEVNQAWIDSAEFAVETAIGLIGMMALWLGFMRVLRDAGLMQSIARALAPLMRRLFPDIPADHPAMSAMILNISANMLGLGNAATPFGLKAMQELDGLNPRKGVATDSMALFLAINTSGVAVFPLGVIAIRATLDSENAGGILIPSILATFCSTVAGVLVAKTLARRRVYAPERYRETASEPDAGATLADAVGDLDRAEEEARPRPPVSRLRLAGVALFGALMVWAMARYLIGVTEGAELAEAGREILKSWLLPLLMAAIALFGFSHRVKVYESFIQGAREGFQIAVMIIPFLVAILVAVGMFRESGALEAIIAAVSPATSLVGFPADALPMALIRPLSGSGAMGVMTETMRIHGPDSFVGYLVSVMNGSTETTFYVLALYFGSVRVRAARHTVAACLCADAVGIAAALFWCRLFF
jgi:spore maturation protein SpmA